MRQAAGAVSGHRCASGAAPGIVLVILACMRIERRQRRARGCSASRHRHGRDPSAGRPRNPTTGRAGRPRKGWRPRCCARPAARAEEGVHGSRGPRASRRESRHWWRASSRAMSSRNGARSQGRRTRAGPARAGAGRERRGREGRDRWTGRSRARRGSERPRCGSGSDPGSSPGAGGPRGRRARGVEARSGARGAEPWSGRTGRARAGWGRWRGTDQTNRLENVTRKSSRNVVARSRWRAGRAFVRIAPVSVQVPDAGVGRSGSGTWRHGFRAAGPFAHLARHDHAQQGQEHAGYSNTGLGFPLHPRPSFRKDEG
jgi:hypothetical protein